LDALLIVNPRSGRGRPDAEELAAQARALGIETRLLRQGEDPSEVAHGSTADVLGVAGGDGSLAPVADVALERGAAFVCIPFGTRNHFARDLGLDRDDPVGTLHAFSGLEHNAYALDFPSLGARERLDEGALHLYFGKDERVGERFVVDSRTHRLEAAVDGEPDVLATPIEFRIEPRALRVLVPDCGG
jgi:diacylglycerol kinase family enzyme